MNTRSRQVFHLPSVLATVAATVSVVAAQAQVDVTLQLARTTVNECEPMWVSYSVTNRSDRQLWLPMGGPGFFFERRDGEQWRPADSFGGESEPILNGCQVASTGSVHGEIRLGYSMTKLDPGEYRMRVWVPPYGVPGAGYSAWHLFTVQPHAGNREFKRRLESTPRTELSCRAAWKFISGGVRAGWIDESRMPSGWPVGITLLQYEQELRAMEAAQLSPMLVAELQLELVAIEGARALSAKHAGHRTTARTHAKAGLAILDALTVPASQRLETGGQPAAIEETRIDLLSISAPEEVKAKRQQLEREFSLRPEVVHAKE